MASSQAFCGTGANFNDGGTTAWSTPTNIQGDTTGTAATCNVGANPGTSQKLRATNFGFAVPSGATIVGVTVEIERVAANANRHFDSNIQIMKAGSETGDNKSAGAAIPTTKAFGTYGGSSDLWGTTLSSTDVNNSGFGVSFKISRSSSQTTTTSVSRVRITVEYSEGRGPLLSFSRNSLIFADDGEL
jgi:hypothetical protein